MRQFCLRGFNFASRAMAPSWAMAGGAVLLFSHSQYVREGVSRRAAAPACVRPRRLRSSRSFSGNVMGLFFDCVDCRSAGAFIIFLASRLVDGVVVRSEAILFATHVKGFSIAWPGLSEGISRDRVDCCPEFLAFAPLEFHFCAVDCDCLSFHFVTLVFVGLIPSGICSVADSADYARGILQILRFILGAENWQNKPRQPTPSVPGRCLSFYRSSDLLLWFSSGAAAHRALSGWPALWRRLSLILV